MPITQTAYPAIEHHGAVDGVTDSCHELIVDADNSVLIDYGLFESAEVSGAGAVSNQLVVDFAVDWVRRCW